MMFSYICGSVYSLSLFLFALCLSLTHTYARTFSHSLALFVPLGHLEGRPSLYQSFRLKTLAWSYTLTLVLSHSLSLPLSLTRTNMTDALVHMCVLGASAWHQLS